MTTMSNRAITAFLLLMIAGASFFCILTNTAPMEHSDQNMPANQGTAGAHFLHAKELALAVVSTTPFVQALFFLIALVVALGHFQKLDLSLEPMLLTYLKRRRRNILPTAQTAVRRWLSLIERSPDILFAPA